MDRLDVFNSLINEANAVPEKFDITHIKKRVKRRYRVRQCLVSARNAAAVLVLFLTVIGIGVNSSTAFAKGISKVPILKNVAKILDFSEREKLKETTQLANDLEATFDYLTVVNQVEDSKEFGFKGRLAYAFADDSGLCVYYTIDKPVDKLVYLDNATIIDKTSGKEVSLICVDSASELKVNKYVLLRFFWSEFHDDIELRLKFSGYPGYNTMADSCDYLTYNISGLTKLDGYKLTTDYRINREAYSLYVKGVDINPASTIAYIGAESDRKVLGKSAILDIYDEKGNRAENVVSGISTVYEPDFKDYKQFFQSNYFKFEGNIYLNVTEYMVALEKNCFKYNVYTHEASLDGQGVDILTICNKDKFDISRGIDGDIKNNIYVEDETELGLPSLMEDCYYLAFPKELGFDIEYQNYDLYSFPYEQAFIIKNWEYNGKLYDVIELDGFFFNEDDCASFSSADTYSEKVAGEPSLIKEGYKVDYKEVLVNVE